MLHWQEYLVRITMDANSTIKDLSLVLAISNYSPTLLTPDFLAGSGVIPKDWELARQPTVSARATQLAFTNGVQIEAKPGIVSFSQGLGNKTLQDLEVPDLVRRYTAALPNLNYVGIGVNPRYLVAFDEQSETAYRYLTQTILSSGSWQTFGNAPLQASISLGYSLENCQLRVNINEAKLQVGEGKSKPALLFAGNFSYPVTGESGEARLESLKGALDNWEKDWATYEDLLDNRFLTSVKGDAVSVFPAPQI